MCFIPSSPSGAARERKRPLCQQALLVHQEYYDGRVMTDTHIRNVFSERSSASLCTRSSAFLRRHGWFQLVNVR